MMDTNQVHKADAGLEATIAERSRLSNGNGDEVGSRAMVSSAGHYESNQASEETPLLPSSPGDASETSPEYTWEGAEDFLGLPWWKQPSVLWLLPPFFLYSLAFGGIAVPRLTLALKLICREYLFEKSLADPSFSFTPVLLGRDNPQCRIPEVQALATEFMLYTTLISGILSAIVSPKLGALSDRYGRRPVLCFITAGGILSEVVVIACAKYPDTVHYSWLLLGAVFEGICGSFIAGMAVTHSYATDCTPPPQRAVAFGYFHGALFGGIALGPLLAGYISKATGDVVTIFIIALACHCVYLVSIATLIPESLSKKRQLAAQEKHRAEEEAAGGSGHWFSTLHAANLLAPLKVLYPTGEGSSAALRANLLLLGAVDTIIFGIAMGVMTVVLYYTELQFGWEDFEKNLFVSITSTARVSVLMIGLPLLNYLFRTRRRNRVRRESGIELIQRNSGSDNLDLNVIRAGLLFELIAFAGYSAARRSPLFVMSGIFASMGGIASPTLQAALTKHVPHDRVGQVLGATGLLHALARIICPTIFSMIYASTVKTFPQVVFIVITGLFGIAVVLSCLVKPHIYLEDQGMKPAAGLSWNEERDAERILDEETTGI